MLTVRKVDMILQAALMIACAFMWPLEETRIFGMVGHIILGAWQVISALCNTYGMSQGPFRQRIISYWIVTIMVLVAFAIWPSSFWIGAMMLGAVIAVYYWFTYRSFIVYLSHREELSTVVRHN